MRKAHLTILLMISTGYGCKPKPNASASADSTVASAESPRSRCSPQSFELRNGIKVDGNSSLSERFAGVGMVSRQINDNQRKVCTGTLISDRHVLTARHCVVSDSQTQKTLVNVASLRFQPIGEAVVKAVAKILLPDFDAVRGPAYTDAALLVLETPVANIAPYAVYRGDDFPLFSGEEMDAVGFGWFVDTNNQREEAAIGEARFGQMIYSESSTFRLDELGPVTVALASATADDQLSCEGDSGGPAFFKLGGMDVIVGVVSASRGDGDTSLDRCRLGERIELAPTTQFANWLGKHVPDLKTEVNVASVSYGEECQ